MAAFRLIVDVFDLGNGIKLRTIFAPGHAQGGVVFIEENNRGMFINDLVGNYFADCGAHYCLNSSTVNHIQGIESLKKLIDIPTIKPNKPAITVFLFQCLKSFEM